MIKAKMNHPIATYLLSVKPALAREWHPTKNGSLTPRSITPNSSKKVWWICQEGHEWEATVAHRSNGRGCPYCAGKSVCDDNCLERINPSLAKQWHPVRNESLTPRDVTPHSQKKVWWVCQSGHEWQATINNRSNGSGCPYCLGRIATKEYCLERVNPPLATEWHSTKNESLTPRDVTPNSNKKVWWICQRGHEWQASINDRSSQESGCPYCTGRYACDDNCLDTINPSLANQWHPTKNESLTPRDVTSHSHKKVWWICQRGHEWQASINDRSNSSGCPYCLRRVATNEYCLETLDPSLAREWHPTKNESLTPRDVTPNSSKKVWWICQKGHEWQATINNRSNGSGCPYCAGRYACDDNCLDTINPSLANQWHPTKNGSLTPRDVTPNSGKKAWWICQRGHEWQATISGRSWGSGCPYCHSSTSKLELGTYCEMKHLFKDVQFRKKVYGQECDIFIPGLRVGIELDGAFWHKNKLEQDKKKQVLLKEKGITLLRVREKGLKRISDADVFFSLKDNHFAVVHRIVSKLVKEVNVSGSARESAEAYLKRKELVNKEEYKQLLDMLPSPLVEFSLQEKGPSLAQEWHPKKNGSLTPRDVSPNSHMKVWWICKKEHEWETTVKNRSNGSGCPYCAGKAVCDDNCLETVNPSLAREWHPTKNMKLTPQDVTPNSSKKVWWICQRGHEWQAIVSSRNLGRGCPYCVGQAACDDNCLKTINPSLAMEWHPTKSGSLTPRDVTPNSGKKAWWICQRGHEWEAVIRDRNRGSGCPYCVGKWY